MRGKIAAKIEKQGRSCIFYSCVVSKTDWAYVSNFQVDELVLIFLNILLIFP